jgi:hypothetical protein
LPPHLYPRLDFGEFHLVQAHQLAGNEDALRWFTDRGASSLEDLEHFPSQPSHFVILDNGAWELGEGNTNALLEVAAQIRPHEIVVPDAFRDRTRTLHLAMKHMEECAKLAYCLMLVPQGETLVEWCQCAVELGAYARASNFWHRACIGIPKVVDSYSGGIWAACAWLAYRELVPVLGVHLLGVWADMTSPLTVCDSYSFIRSIDTTLPLAYALQTRLLFPSAPKIQLKSEDWKAHPTAAQLKMAEINIAIARRLFRGA